MSTIGDVAREAGVSRSTVSSVLTGRKYVTPETRVRVEKAIELLNFTVNSGARALATARTMTLGLVLNFNDTKFVPSASTYVVSLAEQARRNGYRLTLLTGDDSVGEIRGALASKAVDGLLLMEVTEDDPRIRAIRGGGIPGVLIGMPKTSDGVDAVDLDYADAGEQAVNWVHAQGCRRPTLVCWPESLYQAGATYALRFREAVERRAAEMGMTINRMMCAAEPQAMWHSLRSVLGDPDCDSLIFHNDMVVPLLPELLHREHAERLTTIGLCSRQTAQEYWLPFPTLDTMPLESAQLAIEMLVARLRGETEEFQRVLLTPTLNPVSPRP